MIQYDCGMDRLAVYLYCFFGGRERISFDVASVVIVVIVYSLFEVSAVRWLSCEVVAWVLRVL